MGHIYDVGTTVSHLYRVYYGCSHQDQARPAHPITVIDPEIVGIEETMVPVPRSSVGGTLSPEDSDKRCVPHGLGSNYEEPF